MTPTGTGVTYEAPVCPFRACDASQHRDVEGLAPDFDYATVAGDCEYVRCGECRLVHLSRVPDEASMSIIYPSNYYSFEESETEPPLVRGVRNWLELRRIREYAGLMPERSIEVLDVGCGDGRLLDIFARHPLRDWKLSGVEFEGPGARNAAAKGHEIRPGDFMSVDTSDWEGRYDLVLMHQVIEHVHDPRAAVEKIAALMRPGGVFCVETPDTEAWDARMSRRRYWGGYHAPRHFYLFDTGSLGRLMKEAGFEVLWSRSILSPVIWAHTLHHWLVEKAWFRKLVGLRIFRNVTPYYRSAPLLALFALIDLAQIALRGTSSNQQIGVRKPTRPPAAARSES